MSIEEEYQNCLISTSDAASLLRKEIKPNERSFVKKILKANNKLVDRWENEVLKVVCNDDSQVPAGQVYASWMTFFEGISLYKTKNYDDTLFMVPTEEQVEFWVKYFEEMTLEELHNDGLAVVSQGWAIITTFLKNYTSKMKWEKIYSKSDCPCDWDKKRNQYLKISSQKPFWSNEQFKEIREKVMTVLGTIVEP